MIRALVFLILAAAAAAFLSREILEVGAVRRTGGPLLPALRRFRRRTKGVVLLLILYLQTAFFEEVARGLGFGHRAVLLYFGLALVLLVWVLILAGRDLRETVLTAASESSRLRQEAMARLDAEVLARLTERRAAEKQSPKSPDTP